MGTGLDRAEELLSLVVSAFASADVDLPSIQWTQVGEAIVTCESVVAASTIIEPFALPEPGCIPPMTTTLTCTIARDGPCQNQDGTIDPAELTAKSVIQQQDADLLWVAVWSLQRYLGPTDVAVSYLIEGGLVFTTVSVVIGVL